MAKEYTLNVRVNADDLARLKRVAKSQHVEDNLSAVVRALIRKEDLALAKSGVYDDSFSRKWGNPPQESQQ